MSSKRVVLDPGHGLSDPGAIGRDPWTLREADVVFSVALGVRLLLESHQVDVLTTRPAGVQRFKLSLRRRVEIANAFQPNLFVSIHANSVEDPRAHGVEVFHYGSTNGEALAVAILEKLVRKPRVLILEAGHLGVSGTLLRDRGAKRRRTGRGSHLLRATTAPAALVELPFISNPVELKFLASAVFQAHFSRAIAEGILERLGFVV